jgi:hypothetical protein
MEDEEMADGYAEAAGPASFRLAKDLRLPSELRCVAWCPSMDLIALLYQENQLSVYVFS